jgi:hypothetical protein
MSTNQELYAELLTKIEEFVKQHTIYAETGKKVAAKEARKFIGEIKSLATPYKKAQMEEIKASKTKKSIK